MPRRGARPKRLPSGRWQVRYRDANRNQRSQTFRTSDEADRFLKTVGAAVVTGTYVDPRAGKERFADFAHEWAAAQDWKETTRQSFPCALARLHAVLPKQATLASIDQLAIKRARVALAEQYAPNTVKLTMSYLLAIMRAAYATRRLAYDPTVGTRPKRRRADDGHRVGPDQVPTRAEVLAIWNATPARYRAAIALGASGLRIGEVLGMSVDRIDFAAGLIRVDRQLQRIGASSVLTTPKGEKVRTIKVPGSVATELRRHPRDLRGGGLLFVTPRSGRPIQRHEFYTQAWQPALAGAGLDERRYKFHSLRHWCASSMLAEGVNPMAVAGHLGDTLETLQRVYAHWMRDDREMPGDALESILVVHGLCTVDPDEASE